MSLEPPAVQVTKPWPKEPLDGDIVTTTLIRRALHDYRRIHWTNGGYPSWEKVMTDIVFSKKSGWRDHFDKDNAVYKSEALRRFAMRESQGPDDPVIFNCIANFLIGEGIIEQSELDGPDSYLRQMTKLHAALANDRDDARALTSLVRQRYVAVAKEGQEVLEIELHFAPDPSGTLLLADEHCVRRSGKHVAARFFRTGFAFRISGYPALNVFLFAGGSLDDKVHYTETALTCENGTLNLSRHGYLIEAADKPRGTRALLEMLPKGQR